MIKVYRMNDCDWVAAHSIEDAMHFYINECDGEMEPGDVPEELTPEQMLSHEHRGEDGTEYDPPISFKEALERDIADEVVFPCLFATTEI